MGRDRFFELAEPASMLLTNEREAESLTGATDEDAALVLGRRYPTACVKLGPRGAVLASPDGMHRAEAPAVRAVDPTGAGDAFDGVLLAALAAGAGVEEALTRACEAGAGAAATAELWP